MAFALELLRAFTVSTYLDGPEDLLPDGVLTKRLVDAGKLLGIALLNHIILGDGTTSYFSFADEGVL